MISTRPITNSYWVIPGRFLAGEYPRSLDLQESNEKLSRMIAAGITRFIDLTMPADGLDPYENLWTEPAFNGQNVERLSFPITDVSVPETPQQMIEILDTILTRHQPRQELFMLFPE